MGVILAIFDQKLHFLPLFGKKYKKYHILIFYILVTQLVLFKY